MRNLLIILIVFLGVYQLNGQTNITGYQYWFDNDYSNCVNTPITPARQLIVNEAVPTSGLSAGIHSFHFRLFDENGLFSSIISSFFYKNLEQATAVNRKIVAYEYWFDDDFDGAVTQTVTSQKNLNLIADIPTGAISDGIHSFNIRFNDHTGMWSSIQSSFFYKNLEQATAINREIIAYEYWFDDDFDNAVTQTVTSQKNLNLIVDIPSSAISDGIHSFNIRFKDNTVMWSSIQSSFFYKNLEQATAINREIVAYRYWVDDSYDNRVTEILSTPTKSLSLITNLDLSGLRDGEHIIHLQFQDSDGKWSVVISDLINHNVTAINGVEFGIFEVSMTPNPSKGEVFLKINSKKIFNLEVSVLTIMGSEVYRKEYKATDHITLDLSEQVSGVYIVTLKYGDNFFVEKLVLDRR